MHEHLSADSSPEILLDWLHTDGWSLGHKSVGDEWHVTGSKGDRHIRGIGKTIEEAWFKATEQAMLQHASS